MNQRIIAGVSKAKTGLRSTDGRPVEGWCPETDQNVKEIQVKRLKMLSGLLILAMTAMQCVVAGKEFRLGVMDWQSFDSVEAIDVDFSRAMTVNFLLAVQIFNDRRDDLFPVLGEPWAKDCDVNLTVVRYCDTHALLRKSASDTTRLVASVDGIAGYATAAEGQQAAIIADVTQSIPVVSHWCTTPKTEDREVFKFFARTVVSDSDIARRIADLVSQLGYTRVGGLAMIQDSSPELKAAILRELLDRGCVGTFFDYDNDKPDTIESAVRNLAATGLNVAIIIGYNFVYEETMATALYGYNVSTRPNFMALFTNMDYEVDEDATVTNPALREMVRGAVRVSTRLKDEYSSVQEAYLEEWLNGNFQQMYMDKVNDILPPNGSGNDSFFCEDDMFNMTLSSDFFELNADKITDTWGNAFDTVMSIALGSCSSNGTRWNGDLMEDILNLDFVGLSGRVKYDPSTGNRLDSELEFQVQVFMPVEGEPDRIRPVYVGFHNMDNNNFTFLNGSSLYFRNSLTFPPQFDPAPTDFLFVPTWLKAIGRIEFIVIFCAALGCSVWLYYYRKEKIIINSQGPLMHLINVGCAVASFSILLLTFDDSEEPPKVDMNAVCMSIPVLFTVGFQIALLALSGKTYRIYTIWNNTKIMTKKFSLRKVVFVVGFLIVLETTLIAVWIGVAPLKFKRITLSSDRFDQPLASLGMCDAPNWTSGSFAIVVFILHGMSLVVMGFLAYQVSDMPGEFGEAHWLGLACLTLSQIYLISLPAIAAVYSVNVIGRFLLSTSLVFVSAFGLQFFMFAPKMYFLATGKELFRKGTTQSRLNLHREDSKNKLAIQNPSYRHNLNNNSDVQVIRVSESSKESGHIDADKVDKVSNVLRG